jgi:hypothetical protein
MDSQSFDYPKPYTIPLTDNLSVRFYSDCRPTCLETGALQKGLVLLLDGKELIEEGVGFGLPVVKYEDKTFFSSSAQLSVDTKGSSPEIKKTYRMDTISRKKLSNGYYIDDNLYSFVRKKFAKLYLSKKNLFPVFNKLMELREMAKISTEFIKAKSRGTITIDYQCKPTGVNVKVDFSNLTLDACREVLVLNEQGSSIFQKYADTSGLTLLGNKIGAWDAVVADKALLLSLSEHVSFSLQNARDATLYRGWEKTRNRFSWAGLSYSMRPSNGTFKYSIGVKLKT